LYCISISRSPFGNGRTASTLGNSNSGAVVVAVDDIDVGGFDTAVVGVGAGDGAANNFIALISIDDRRCIVYSSHSNSLINIPVSGGKGDGGGGDSTLGNVAATETESDIGGGLRFEADTKAGRPSGFAGMACNGLKFKSGRVIVGNSDIACGRWP